MKEVNSTDNTPNNSNAKHQYQLWYDRGTVLANSGNYGEALVNLDKAVEIENREPACWVLRAVVLIHLQRYTEALSSCEKAVALDPKHQEAWLIRGAALNHLGQFKQSYSSYDKALSVERQSIWQKLNKMFKNNLVQFV